MYRVEKCRFVELYSRLLNTELHQVIIHSLDVAKASSAIAKRLGCKSDMCSIYLSGLLHDIGFVLYANIKNMESFRKFLGYLSVSSHGAIVFDMDDLLSNLDSRSDHAIVSWAMAKNLLPEEYSSAILYHHEPNKASNFEDVHKLSWTLNVADVISNIYRRESKRNEAEAVASMLKYLENLKTPYEDVKKATFDFVKDPIDFSMMTDTHHHVGHFVDRVEYFDLDEIIEFFKIFVYLVDFRSPFTRNHSSSIAILARDLAYEILKSEFDAKIMYAAGLIHDIGKVRTPLDILHKPGRLSSNELIVMRRHIAHTIRLTYGLKEISEILQIAYLHHERLDGSGYPFGLSAKDLSMKSRILQVADIFVALTEDRPYREGMDYRKALSIIEDEVKKGKLDPDVFEALKVMLKNGYELPKKGNVIEEIFERKIDIETLEEVFK